MTRPKTDKPLTLRQENFANYYATCGSETQGDAIESAKKAGYAEDSIRTSAWKVKNLPRVQARIKEIHDRNSERYAGSLYSIFERLLKKAEDSNKIAEAVNAADKMCKMCGVYKADEEQQNVEQKELTELQRQDQDLFNEWKRQRLLGIENPKILSLEAERIRKEQIYKECAGGG